jgi:antitoxin (DNA-binding transcriptional repressor) of toxin-antitoxin stability system
MDDPQRIDLAEFLADIDRYVEAAEAGSEIWITRDGKPICQLSPID